MFAEGNPDLPGVSSVEVDSELAGYLAARLLTARMTDRAAREGGTFGPLLVVRR